MFMLRSYFVMLFLFFVTMTNEVPAACLEHPTFHLVSACLMDWGGGSEPMRTVRY